jgi:hypothetical protein
MSTFVQKNITKLYAYEKIYHRYCSIADAVFLESQRTKPTRHTA